MKDCISWLVVFFFLSGTAFGQHQHWRIGSFSPSPRVHDRVIDNSNNNRNHSWGVSRGDGSRYGSTWDSFGSFLLSLLIRMDRYPDTYPLYSLAYSNEMFHFTVSTVRCVSSLDCLGMYVSAA